MSTFQNLRKESISQRCSQIEQIQYQISLIEKRPQRLQNSEELRLLNESLNMYKTQNEKDIEANRKFDGKEKEILYEAYHEIEVAVDDNHYPLYSMVLQLEAIEFYTN